MSKAYLTPQLFCSQEHGFSQTVATKGSTTIYLSGQVAWNAEQQGVGPLDDKQPSSPWIGVPALASTDFLIEIEAVAVLD